MNFLEFIEQKNSNLAEKNKFFESYNIKDTEKVIGLIDKILKKHVNTSIGLARGVENTIINNEQYLTYTWFSWDTSNVKSLKDINVLLLNYKLSENSGNVSSVSFMNGQAWWDSNAGTKSGTKIPLTIYTLNTSIIYLLPLIYRVLNTGDFDVTKEEFKKYSGQVYRNLYQEAKEYDWKFNALTYRIYENLDDKTISDIKKLNEGYDYDQNVKSFKIKMKKRQDDALDNWKKNAARLGRKGSLPNKEKYLQYKKEYQTVLDAIRGGATNMEDIEVAFKHNLPIKFEYDDTIKEAEKQVKAFKDPKQQFKEMAVYVNSVINGLQPGVILCGGPGIGKTFRVKQHLKAHGKRYGQNLDIFKGKGSTRELYKSMYNYKRKGDIILVDDADGLVGKGAPEDCINLLKAALDSTDDDGGRLITYKVAGKLLDDDGTPIPKSFHYNGGMIVITNHTIDQLDKAFRGRVFTQSLNFSNEQILDIVKELIPTMSPQLLSMKSKMKAYNYILSLVKENAKIEVSLRTFVTCSKLFQNQETMTDLTDADIESMIKEQLENQAL